MFVLEFHIFVMKTYIHINNLQTVRSITQKKMFFLMIRNKRQCMYTKKATLLWWYLRTYLYWKLYYREFNTICVINYIYYYFLYILRQLNGLCCAFRQLLWCNYTLNVYYWIQQVWRATNNLIKQWTFFPEIL